jgi:hypothetical protein
MATVNLGAIKFNWKGAYSNSTAYAVDDVVSSGGSSYVCIQAHTNQPVGNATAYWNIMSSAGTNGTNGTDVGTTLTTQGDILYRDGSGLQRLGAGTSGHALVTKGSGQNPVWESVGGGTVLRVFTKAWFGGSTISGASSSWRQINNYNSERIVPLSTSSKFVIQWTVSGYANDDHHFFKIHRRADNGSDTDVGLSNSLLANDTDYGDTGSMVYGRHTNATPLKTFQIYDAPNTTSGFTYQLMNQAHGATFYFGRSAHNTSSKQYASQNTCIVWELDGSNTTMTNNASN